MRLKLIRKGRSDDREAFERFEREVRLTATLSHPNTVEIYDYGRTEDGTYYYVMEYLPGLSLSELVERHGPLPPGPGDILAPAGLPGLHEAHADRPDPSRYQAIEHLRRPPSRPMDDVAKLLDFGLVLTGGDRIAEPERHGVTGSSARPLSCPPSRILGDREVDARSDIYSLGAVAYYLLTGRPPFPQRGGMAALIAHVRDPVVPLTELRSDVPADLERIVLACLAKEPVERPADVDAVERAAGATAPRRASGTKIGLGGGGKPSAKRLTWSPVETSRPLVRELDDP